MKVLNLIAYVPVIVSLRRLAQILSCVWLVDCKFLSPKEDIK